MNRAGMRSKLVATALGSAAVVGIVTILSIAPASGSLPSAPATSEPLPSGSGPSTTGLPVFVDGADARAAAEDLMATYIESEFGVTVTDVACSVPESGEVDEGFTCYALKPDDLVIAVRATIRPQRAIEVDLLLDVQPTTTSTSTTTTTTTTEALTATSDGGPATSAP